MNPDLLKIKMFPSSSDMSGGNLTDPIDTPPPTLNSAADSGLTPEELAAPPVPESGEPDGTDGNTPNYATPGDPNLAGSAPRQSATEGAVQTIVDAARHYGLDLSSYADDGQAFAALVQMAQRGTTANYYADLGQRIAPHYEAVQQFIAQRQAAEAKPTERKSWEAPAFDEKWLNLVDKDPNTGMFVALPGAPPWVAEKVQAYADHLENWTTQLARNPMEALSPLVNHLAEQLLEQRFGQQAAHQQAAAIVQQNESWLYATDAQGRRQVGRDGKYVPTPLGARYHTHLQNLSASGVRDAATLDAIAKQLLQADIYASQANRGAAAAEPDPRTFAAAGRPNVNPGQAVDPSRRAFVPGATDPSATGLSLREQLALAMAEEGVSDADFRTPSYGS